jgi:hypothetical protein
MGREVGRIERSISDLNRIALTFQRNSVFDRTTWIQKLLDSLACQLEQQSQGNLTSAFP